MATEIIDEPATVAQALSDAFNGVACELSYIVGLADLLYEQAEDCSDPIKIEAMCLSIRRLAESVHSQLGKRVDAATA